MSLSFNPTSISVAVCNTAVEDNAKNLQLSPFMNKGSGLSGLLWHPSPLSLF